MGFNGFLLLCLSGAGVLQFWADPKQCPFRVRGTLRNKIYLCVEATGALVQYLGVVKAQGPIPLCTFKAF